MNRLLAVLAILAGSFPAPAPGGQAVADDRLAKILAETAAYCERLKAMALDFVCRESIADVEYEFSRKVAQKAATWDIGINQTVEDLRVRKIVKRTFVYDYQMARKGGEFRERRDLVEENGRPRSQKDVSLKAMRIATQFLVFGPVGLLSRYWQSRFSYEIAGTEAVGGTPAIVIAVSPKDVREENYYRGRVWVAEGDSSILKIELEPLAPEAAAEKIESAIGNLRRKVVMTAEYGIVKNGVRFPSVQEARETYTTAEGKEHVKYESRYLYADYRFFTVETDVAVKK